MSILMEVLKEEYDRLERQKNFQKDIYQKNKSEVRNHIICSIVKDKRLLVNIFLHLTCQK